MPVVVWWGIVGIAGLLAANEVVDSAGDAAAKSAGLAKWVAIGGGIYLGYGLAKKAGYIK